MLSRPSDTTNNHRMTVKSLMDSPFNVYFMREDMLLRCNQECAETCGFDSSGAADGTSLYNHPYLIRSSAESAINNNKQAVRSRRTLVTEENLLRNNEDNLVILTFKMPWYDHFNKILGTFGCSIVLAKHQLAASLTRIVELGLLNKQQSPQLSLPGHCNNGQYLTKREIDCLRHIASGKTAREMADYLSISRRTIEHHIENLKSKLRITSKSELIEYAQLYLKTY